MTFDPRPIGVFDSGIGGLTTVRELFQCLPGESVVYFGDTGRFPYGPKPADEVRGYALEIADLLVDRGVKMLVVACNSAASAALDDLRARHDIPIIGVVGPGIRAAAQVMGSSIDHAAHAAEAIMTSDSRPKQIAIEFKIRYPEEFAKIGKPVGGKGTGQPDSVAQYFALELSRRIKNGSIKNIEGRFLHRGHLKTLQYYDDVHQEVESSLMQNFDLSLYRLLD